MLVALLMGDFEECEEMSCYGWTDDPSVAKLLTNSGDTAFVPMIADAELKAGAARAGSLAAALFENAIAGAPEKKYRNF